ncbi:MAG TPA: hypothetical protein VGR51_09955 [Thermoplasmata archaeon]|nr:hypothetical protein [Thermoplasmata archaeon]
MTDRDPTEEERDVLKEKGVIDEHVLRLMDVFVGDKVRWKFYYGDQGFEELTGHFLGFYTLFEGPEGGGDVNLIIKVHRDGKDAVLYKDRNYLAEFEVVEPNTAAREEFQRIHDTHGRRVGREFG